MKKIITKKSQLPAQRGSILVFTLFIMTISLVVGIGLMSSSSITRKSTLASSKSVNSFQIADTGLEFLFLEIRNFYLDNGKTISGKEIKDVFGGCEETENNAFIENNIGTAEVYKLVFYLDDLTVGTDCEEPFVNIKKIKSIGSYGGTSRVMEAAVDFTSMAL